MRFAQRLAALREASEQRHGSVRGCCVGRERADFPAAYWSESLRDDVLQRVGLVEGVRPQRFGQALNRLRIAPRGKDEFGGLAHAVVFLRGELLLVFCNHSLSLGV